MRPLETAGPRKFCVLFSAPQGMQNAESGVFRFAQHGICHFIIVAKTLHCGNPTANRSGASNFRKPAPLSTSSNYGSARGVTELPQAPSPVSFWHTGCSRGCRLGALTHFPPDVTHVGHLALGDHRAAARPREPPVPSEIPSASSSSGRFTPVASHEPRNSRTENRPLGYPLRVWFKFSSIVTTTP